MRLDHVSYVASHDQISDVVNRIGSQIGTAFVDGGIHPKFGTRNFTAPLLNGQYVEIVCPLDHPATDATPFGRAVKIKANDGGGWLSWIISTKDLTPIETELGRKSVAGKRTKPNGDDLLWKQLGVLSVLEDASLPFYIEWLAGNHPSQDGKPLAKIKIINVISEKTDFLNYPGVKQVLDNKDFELKWIKEDSVQYPKGISSIEFEVGDNLVEIN
jgi:hypothetical protein